MAIIEIYHNTERETFSVHPPDDQFSEIFGLDYVAALDEAEAMQSFYAKQGLDVKIEER